MCTLLCQVYADESHPPHLLYDAGVGMEDKAAGYACGEREVRGPPNRSHGHGEKGPLKQYM